MATSSWPDVVDRVTRGGYRQLPVTKGRHLPRHRAVPFGAIPWPAMHLHRPLTYHTPPCIPPYQATDVKLGDLGAARNVKREEDYTYIATTMHLPARWMPLEAIRDAKFSHKSDVFSFGVLLWELCSFGRPPWGAFGLTDIIDSLKKEERLQKQPGAPDSMHEMCLRCWATDPASRPSFAQVNDELQILPAIIMNTRQKNQNTAPGNTKPPPQPRQSPCTHGLHAGNGNNSGSDYQVFADPAVPIEKVAAVGVTNSNVLTDSALVGGSADWQAQSDLDVHNARNDVEAQNGGDYAYIDEAQGASVASTSV